MKDIKKNIVIVVIIFLIVGIGLYYFFDSKNSIYEPTVEYEEETIADEESSTKIVLDGNNADIDGQGASLNNNIVTILSSGTYYLSGTFDGGIVVDTDGIVYLVLNGVNITSTENAAILVLNSQKTVIDLKGSNTLTDSSCYNETDEQIDATIYSKDDLVIMGEGTLNINANYNHGIKSKDSLQIINGTINITSVNDGIIGKDYFAIKSGTITINSGSDGMKATEESDATLGYIIIDGGIFNINSKGDAIEAITSLTINDGTFDIKTNGGSTTTLTSSSASCKGLKAGTNLIINDGKFTINSADDSIHSDDIVSIKNGTFDISSGDDGIHGSTSLTIDNGSINITKSYEGLEGLSITINNGTINLNSSDDGINAAGGNDASAVDRIGANGTNTNNGNVYINGGTIYLNAAGDGLDSNGSIKVTGGTIVVNGPLDNGNGALDYNSNFTMTGGILVASGSSGMAQNIGTDSSQYGISLTLTQTITSGTLISIFDSSNNEVFTYKAAKNYSNIVICLPTLSKGTYTVYTGGTTSKSETNGIYETGGYSGGTKYTTFTISSITTNIGNAGNIGGPRR